MKPEQEIKTIEKTLTILLEEKKRIVGDLDWIKEYLKPMRSNIGDFMSKELIDKLHETKRSIDDSHEYLYARRESLLFKSQQK